MTTSTARRLRQRSTDAERKLWRHLANRQFGGAKFRRQQPVGPYIADFFCAEAKLIVELDGGQHTPQGDAARTEWLERAGYRVVRFWNNDVLTNTEGVLMMIEQALGESRETEAFRVPSPLEGEG